MTRIALAALSGALAAACGAGLGQDGDDGSSAFRPASASSVAGASPVEIWHYTEHGHVEVLYLPASAAADHLAHGDGTNPIHVDDDGSLDGSGLPGSPMRRVTDALSMATTMRAAEAGGRIEIRVAPGLYQGSYLQASLDEDPTLEALPFVLDIPQLSLLGSAVPVLDADGLPTGAVESATATRLVPRLARPDLGKPAEALGPGDSQVWFYITDSTHADGTTWAGDGTTLAGFALASGNTGTARAGAGVIAVRVHDVAIADLVLEPNFGYGIDARFSGLTVDVFYAQAVGACIACVNGSDIDLRGARLADSLIGVFVSPGLQNVAPSLGTHTDRTVAPVAQPTDISTYASIEDSDLTGFNRNAISSGVRVIAVGPNSVGTLATADLTVDIRRTRLGASSNGVFLDAGFVSFASPGPDVTYDVSFDDIAWSPVTRSPVSVSFTRAQVAAGIGNPHSTPYLSGASWSIDGLGTQAPLVWIDHPVEDPVTEAQLGNSLAIDGVIVGEGTCQGAWPATTCP